MYSTVSRFLAGSSSDRALSAAEGSNGGTSSEGASSLRRRRAAPSLSEEEQELLKQATQECLTYKPGVYFLSGLERKKSHFKPEEQISVAVVGPKGSGKSAFLGLIDRSFGFDGRAFSMFGGTLHGTDGCYSHVFRWNPSIAAWDVIGFEDQLSAEQKEELRDYLVRDRMYEHKVERKDNTAEQRAVIQAYNEKHAGKYFRVHACVFVFDIMTVGDKKLEHWPALMLIAKENRTRPPVIVLTHADLLPAEEVEARRLRMAKFLGLEHTSVFALAAAGPEALFQINQLQAKLVLCELLHNGDQHLRANDASSRIEDATNTLDHKLRRAEVVWRTVQKNQLISSGTRNLLIVLIVIWLLFVRLKS